jgi:hypothetical protein
VLFSRLYQGISKVLLIRFGSKNHLAVVAALDDVLRLAGYDIAGKTGHGVDPGRKETLSI